MKNALDLTLNQWREALESIGEPAYRASQIFAWLHRGISFTEMTNIPAPLRKKLSETYAENGIRIAETLVSKLDGTEKYLFYLQDGHLIEGVRMRYKHGDTLCLSTQVGCRMGCVFCASALDGLARNLSRGEMIGQIVAVNKRSPIIHNLVLMGSGEPLDNYDETIGFLRLLKEPGGLQTSLRSVSLSTCGIAPKIRRLAEEGLPVTLSISLHAPDDALRRTLLPVTTAYPMDELLSACRYYLRKTGRRVLFEYAMIDGVNDSESHAQALSSRLRGMQCHVNLIPLNEVEEYGLRRSPKERVDAFQTTLEAFHISVTKRRVMGLDLSGACGQLRRRYLREGDNDENGMPY
ncbi:MAG: 23S rRNA (adenine(2503)-C(2))-methyltransferase RlmN [Clostridia bacterium]|nr:23S rRNA (adenine(2503)-C(2))-methyltransferase RlmN [Clostridia bacterium]